jgi:hypothetical protein
MTRRRSVASRHSVALQVCARALQSLFEITTRPVPDSQLVGTTPASGEVCTASTKGRTLACMALLVLSLMLTLMAISGVVGVRLLMNKVEKRKENPDLKDEHPPSPEVLTSDLSSTQESG